MKYHDSCSVAALLWIIDGFCRATLHKYVFLCIVASSIYILYNVECKRH